MLKINDNMENGNLIAPCGMNCALCHSFQDEKKRCPGCRSKSVSVRKSCRNCVIAGCTRKSDYCFECSDFPCKRLKALDERYRSQYKMSMLDNLDDIAKDGVDVFFSRQKEKYICPECGLLRTVHYDYCIYCKRLKSKRRLVDI